MICPLCGGKGVIPVRRIHFGDGIYKPEKCNICDGTGHVKEIKTDKLQITLLYADYSV